MLLNELLDAAVKYEVVDQDEQSYQELAHVHGRDIIFVAEQSGLLQTNKSTGKACYPWEVAFMEKLNNKSDDDYPYTIHKTGSGGEMQVFAFVKAALHRWVEKYKPQQFSFSAALNEPSRVRLYIAFIKRFSQHGFHVEVHDIHGDRNWIFTPT